MNLSDYICKPQTYSACYDLIGPELMLMLHARHLQKACLINSWLPIVTH